MRVTIVLPFHFFSMIAFHLKLSNAVQACTHLVLQYLGRITYIYTSFYTNWANNFIQEKRYRNEKNIVYIFCSCFLVSCVLCFFSMHMYTYILCLVKIFLSTRCWSAFGLTTDVCGVLIKCYLLFLFCFVCLLWTIFFCC